MVRAEPTNNRSAGIDTNHSTMFTLLLNLNAMCEHVTVSFRCLHWLVWLRAAQNCIAWLRAAWNCIALLGRSYRTSMSDGWILVCQLVWACLLHVSLPFRSSVRLSVGLRVSELVWGSSQIVAVAVDCLFPVVSSLWFCVWFSGLRFRSI